MTVAEKIKGPASYFPSIEQKYGQPIGHWLEIAGSQESLSHMQVVGFLKEQYGLGHGHANAIVAHVFAEKSKG